MMKPSEKIRKNARKSLSAWNARETASDLEFQVLFLWEMVDGILEHLDKIEGKK